MVKTWVIVLFIINSGPYYLPGEIYLDQGETVREKIPAHAKIRVGLYFYTYRNNPDSPVAWLELILFSFYFKFFVRSYNFIIIQ